VIATLLESITRSLADWFEGLIPNGRACVDRLRAADDILMQKLPADVELFGVTTA
jgi:hypothetical protein